MILGIKSLILGVDNKTEGIFQNKIYRNRNFERKGETEVIDPGSSISN